MSNKPITIWQVANGNSKRSYADLFLKYDVMAIGEGDVQESLTRFSEAQRGDYVVLREDRRTVRAIGRIVDTAPLNRNDFRDVDGWRLHSIRRVLWFAGTEHTFPEQVLPRVTFSRLYSQPVTDWFRSLCLTTPKRSLIDLPRRPVKLTFEALLERLSTEGVKNAQVRLIGAAGTEVLTLTKWYSQEAIEPSESETVAYLVLPLLTALGWDRKSVAIERKKVDIALFNTDTRTDNDLVGIIEVKRQGGSLRLAAEQAQGYASRYQSCHLIVTTDGVRYATYLRENHGFRLTGYVNLMHILETHGLMDNCRAVDAIISLLGPLAKN